MQLFDLIFTSLVIMGGILLVIIVVRLAITKGMEENMAKIEARNKERLALIEKGMDPTILDKKSHGPLLWGLLLGGIALGALIGYLISFYSEAREDIMTQSLGLLFGGIGLVIYYVYREKTDAKKAG